MGDGITVCHRKRSTVINGDFEICVLEFPSVLICLSLDISYRAAVICFISQCNAILQIFPFNVTF